MGYEQVDSPWTEEDVEIAALSLPGGWGGDNCRFIARTVLDALAPRVTALVQAARPGKRPPEPTRSHALRLLNGEPKPLVLGDDDQGTW
jgi:hypothetical protein